MKILQTLVLCSAASAMAQGWEVGGGAGGGFYTSQTISSAAGSASAKIQDGVSAGVWLGNSFRPHLGGEVRYEYGTGDLALSSGGTTATFGAHSQQFHYDVVWHVKPSESRIRPFVAAGAGVKLYQGVGTQMVYQPLSNIAFLTQQQDLTPLVSAGAGVKIQLKPHVLIRLDVHDYLTPFPKNVIVPNVGAKVGGWLQDFVPMIGISYTN